MIMNLKWTYSSFPYFLIQQWMLIMSMIKDFNNEAVAAKILYHSSV